MAAYYNEIDPYAAQWLRNLIEAGHIADGIVDERSIVDVSPEDLRGFIQCHFFAGLGGWSRALRLAGWPDNRPVWTGSPPCQPFSTAGRQLGKDDERHLAPHWLDLVTEYGPPTVFGEQVEAAIRKDWLDDLQVHLEAKGYACGAIVLPACSVGAPHLRQRLWLVAKRLVDGSEPGLERLDRDGSRVDQPGWDEAEPSGSAGAPSGAGSGLAYHGGAGFEVALQHAGDGRSTPREGQADERGSDSIPVRPGPTNGFWGTADWLYCRDEKWRPVEPGTFPLAHGVSDRVGKLRAYGNAIVPQVAAEVIRAYMEVTP